MKDEFKRITVYQSKSEKKEIIVRLIQLIGCVKKLKNDHLGIDHKLLSIILFSYYKHL